MGDECTKEGKGSGRNLCTMGWGYGIEKIWCDGVANRLILGKLTALYKNSTWNGKKSCGYMTIEDTYTHGERPKIWDPD